MATFYYENQYSKDDDDEGKKKKKSILDNINSSKESTGRADDILSMIRARNNPNIDYQLPDPPKKQSTKLKELLNKISTEDPEVPDYWDTPIYKMGYDEGFSDGVKEGWDQATKHYYETLDAIKVLIKREQQ